METDERLVWNVAPGCSLVRERVSTYDFFQGAYPSAVTYDKSFPQMYKEVCWAGDQGLILGAMIDFLSILPDPNYAPQIIEVVQSILDGVIRELVDRQGILKSWRSPDGSFPPGDEPDYATGVGIYMRYLLHVFLRLQEDPGLQRFISLQTCKPFIQKNADAVCKSIGDCSELPYGCSLNDPMECWLNQLAVLNAASVILRLDEKGFTQK